MSLPVPSNRVFLAVDTSGPDGLTGQSPQMLTWILGFDQSGSALGTAKNFVGGKNFPLGSRAYFQDLSVMPLQWQVFELQASWVVI